MISELEIVLCLRLTLRLKPEATTVRGLEVIAGTGRRRWLSADHKARMIEETLVPGAVVSEVARRHGLAPQQLFTWRRQARQPGGADMATEAPQFVPAVVESVLPEAAARRRQRPRRRPMDGASGIIEVEIDGVSVRVGRGADVKTVAVVIRTLKADT